MLSRLRSSRATGLTLFLALGLTAVLYAGARRLEDDNARLQFEQVAGARHAVVVNSFRDAIEALDSMTQLVTAFPAVSRSAFQDFTEPIIARNPYFQALELHRLVHAQERRRFESQRQAEFPGYKITEWTNGHVRPTGTRPVYLVVDYIVPLRRNRLALGYDTLVDPAQRDFMLRVIDSGRTMASSVVPLVQGVRRGVVIVTPLYRRGADVSSPAARRVAFVGNTAVVIDAEVLIAQSFKRAQLIDIPGVSVAVYGPAQKQGYALAFSNGASTPAPGAAWFSERFGVAARTRTEAFDVAGQRWLMVVSYRANAFATSLGSLVTLFFGTLLSIVAAAYTRARALRSEAVERLVTERTADLRRASDALRLHQRAIESSANTFIIARATAPDYPIEYVNPAFVRAFGYSAQEVRGSGLLSVGLADPQQPGIDELRLALREQREAKAFLQYRRRDGTVMLSDVYIAPVRDAHGVTEHFVLIQYDVTAAKTYEAELEFHAKYDTLTGLANRWVLLDRLEQALGFARNAGERVWIVIIDLDHFKFVNDALGHQAGDQLLREVASRTAAAVGPTDTVARIGGDEFALVLVGRSGETQVKTSVDAVMEVISRRVRLDGRSMVISCSAGVAEFPTDGGDAETLLKHAEIAMHRSKELGRHTVQFYTAAMNRRADERMNLEFALRSALARRQFELHYQPQVDIASNRIVGMEALLRWRHPTLGMVRPDRFIALAEETGVIDEIGAWVLRTACFQNRQWQLAGLGKLRIGVNLSARQFLQADLPFHVAGVLAESGLAAECLEIEVTESLIMSNLRQAVQAMQQLKELGVKLAIDDFGTGYSSLSYLTSFPVDVLKIDQSFVRDISVHPDHAVMVGAIVSLGHSLRLSVIAEGVETEEQFAYLRRCGCDEVQGFLTGRAVPVEHFEQMVAQDRRR